MRRVVILLALLCPLVSARAQRATLAGVIRGDASSTGLADVEISIPSLGRVSKSTPSGEFRVADLTPGRHEIILRRLGYQVLHDTIDLQAGVELRREYMLRSAITRLDSVRVSAAPSERLPPQLEALERRRTQGFGHFLTEADLAKVADRRLGEILGTIPGTRLIRYRGYSFLASGRGDISISPRGRQRDAPTVQHAIVNDDRSPTGCWVAIYLDGLRIFGPNLRQDVPDLAEYEGRQFSGIEFYAGPSNTPTEFNQMGSACGTLVLWTRWR